jgi:hypothetical protein
MESYPESKPPVAALPERSGIEGAKAHPICSHAARQSVAQVVLSKALTRQDELLKTESGPRLVLYTANKMKTGR